MHTISQDRYQATSQAPLVRRRCEDELIDLIPALRAFARTFHPDPTDADDLVQETLTKGIGNMHQFQPGTSMKSWLFTIMRNTFYTRIKVYNRECPAAADCASSRPTMLPSQEWSMRSHEICRTIQRLPYEQREALILIAMLGMSYLDTAEICDCAIGTVKSRLNRARQNLVELSGETSVQAMVGRIDSRSLV